ncbi:MAG: DNA polymerase III subunit gamma/tau [Defluviitaleaceae bacterium]|nr:DNA polymerase III subunit gamma/tau [Defluviitaleaceae bacterium]
MYTALYRKLRPTAFADVVGQEHIVRTLTNQIIHERVSHAYLFCGVRGTGKTSCAKIFARAVNCMQPNNGEACGACVSCVDIARGANMDVIEIDAASNNGVDNIRDLREEVRYPPSGKYKVYIIDEVHMLSTGAFNALLKTLEEPPSHVIFILATTDPQKIPATIHSRVMRFDFHRISANVMTAALRGYVDEEGIGIANDALDYVVQIADGSMRDALSLLDRLAGLYYCEEITLNGALDVTGSMSAEAFYVLFNALIGGNANSALDLIEDISAKGRDFAQFADEFLGYLRNMMLENPKEIIPLITHFAGVARNIKQSGANARLALEIGCIEWAAGGNEGLLGNKNEETKVVIPTQKPDIMPAVDIVLPVEATVENIVPQFVEIIEDVDASSIVNVEVASGSPVANVIANWAGFVANLEPFLASFVKKARVYHLDNDTIYLVCADDDKALQTQLSKKQDVIAEKLSTQYNVQFAVVVTASSNFAQLHIEKFGKPPQDDPNTETLQNLIDFNVKIM